MHRGDQRHDQERSPVESGIGNLTTEELNHPRGNHGDTNKQSSIIYRIYR